MTAQCNGNLFVFITSAWIYGGDATRANIMYVDYGNTETVNRSALKGIPNALWKVAPQAVPFRIQGEIHDFNILYLYPQYTRVLWFSFMLNYGIQISMG
jgi:hypothetical protein